MVAGGHQCRTVVCDAHCQNLRTVLPGEQIKDILVSHIQFIDTNEVIAGLSMHDTG